MVIFPDFATVLLLSALANQRKAKKLIVKLTNENLAYG